MSEALKRMIREVVSKEYSPGLKLEYQLGAFLQSFAKRLSAAQIYAFINNFGCVLANESKNVFIQSEKSQLSEPIFFPGSQDMPHKISALTVKEADQINPRRDLTFPILFQEQSIGTVVFQAGRKNIEIKRIKTALKMIAREIAFHVIRHFIKKTVEIDLGKEFVFVGTSVALREVEVQVERSARVDLPIVLSGEYGVEFQSIAHAIHYCSARRGKPFIEINCANLLLESENSDPAMWFKWSDQGTLFLNNIDQLDLPLQNHLASLVESAAINGHSHHGNGAQEHDVRIIAATSEDLDRLIDEKIFSRQLFDDLNFLEIDIPAVRERDNDLEVLIDLFVDKYKQHKNQCFTEESLSLLKRYHWPNNIIELERLIARILVKSGRQQISAEEIKSITPHLLEKEVSELKPVPIDHSVSESLGVNESYIETYSEEKSESSDSVNQESLPHCVLSNDLEFLGSGHPCIKKAIEFISENYQREITLTELARVACVSPSHLCFLFRTNLNTTFKALLGMTRIERAKMLLIEQPDLAITTISLEVGFRDLSHFEKTFRKLVKLNPRDYRRHNSDFSQSEFPVSRAL